MITLEKPYSVRKSGIENEGISFGIKKDGLAHIFNVLRNQLYSNKILAVIREYSCNAYDAMVEAGTSDQKFVVTCPTFDDPCFKVRDFGSGLSPEGIAEVYAYYGESTKRQSNAFIGQLGLGSKSGFAYGDNFVIRSFYRGTLYTYNAYLDETKIGQILLMDEEATSENDGVEIVIPVKVRDISTFKETIANFFKHFKSKPIINNIEKIYLEVYWKDEGQILHGQGWQFLKCKNSWDKTPSLMIMGNVAYPMDGNSVDGLNSVFYNDFTVEFEIGELEVSASREALQFSAKTQSAIKKRFKSIMEEVTKNISDKLKNAKSLFEAKSIYNSLTIGTGDFYRFQSQFKNLMWNNKDINNHTLVWNTIADKKVTVFEIAKSNRSDRINCRVLDSKTIHCYASSRLYIDDTNHKFMQRLAHYVYDQKNTDITKIYVVEFDDDQGKKDWLFDVGMDESELVYASSEKINKIEYPKNSSGVSVDENPKHICSEFKLDLAANKSYYKVKSDQFEEAAFNLDAGGVYININRFYCKAEFDGHTECVVEAGSFINLLNKCSFKGFEIQFPEVACLKHESAEKAIKNPNWRSLKGYIKDYISENWTDGQSQKLVNYIEFRRFQKEFPYELKYLYHIKNISAIKDFCDLVDSFKLWHEVSVADEIISMFARTGLLQTVTAGLQPTHCLSEEIKKVKNKYAILDILDWYRPETALVTEKYLQLEEKSLTTTPVTQ
jgi:hypothetical protein